MTTPSTEELFRPHRAPARDETAERRHKEAIDTLFSGGDHTWRDLLAAAPFDGPWAGCVRLDNVVGSRKIEYTGACRAYGDLLPLSRRCTVAPYARLFTGLASHFDETSGLHPSIEKPVLRSTLCEFESHFNRHNPNVLSRLKSVKCTGGCKWVVAGGSVLRALLRHPPSASTFEGTDIDIFICTNEEDGGTTLSCADEEEMKRRRCEEATKLAKRIFDALAVDGEHWVISRGLFVINMHRWGAPIHHMPSPPVDPPVQIVLRLYQSPSEVLHGFDIDPCCVAYDGQGLYALPRAIESLRYGQIILNPLHAWPNEPAYELRLAKYAGVALLWRSLVYSRIWYITGRSPTTRSRI